MIIRDLKKTDDPYIFRMLRNFRDSGLIPDMEDCDDERYIKHILDHIRAGAGLGLVAETEDDVLGMILAIKTPYVWNPDTFVLNELCFWVDPEYRRTTAGYRLIQRFTEMAQLMKDEGKIRHFVMVRRAGTNIDYSRFGYRPAEENWIR